MTRNVGATSRKRALGRSLPPALLVLAALLGAEDRVQPGAEPMRLSVGRSIVLDRSSDVTRISISNPDVVDAVAVSTREILVNAKSAGLATIVMWSKAGERNVYAVTVSRDLEPIRQLLKDTFPGEVIDVRADGDSLALIGRASTQPIADRALALVAPLVKVVVNNLQVVPPGADKQIVLRVKFAEVNRSVVTSFGVNLLSTGALNTPFRTSTQQFASGSPSTLQGQIPGQLGGTVTNFSLSDVLNIFAFRPDLNLGAIIRDLQTQGLLQILAEPNLVTTNGKEASFLVGGEFPIPVLQGGTNNAVTIQFREFGIRLNFLPQVTANHTIKLHVKPEISTIDLANGVVFSGFTIPALATRRMETDIELGEGQTFLIGGLLDDRVTESLSKVPGLSHIPILGALFKSRSENKSKTELLVMVTPETTYPFSPTDVKPMPHMLKEFLPDAPSQIHSDKNTPPRAGVVRPVTKPSADGAADQAPDSAEPAKEIASSPGQAGAR